VILLWAGAVGWQALVQRLDVDQLILRGWYMRFSSGLFACLVSAALLILPPLANAQAAPLVRIQQAAPMQPAALIDLLKIDALIEVMRLEGVRYGAEMEAEMFAGEGGAGWEQAVSLIYDAPTMRARFEAAFADGLIGVDLAAINGFFAAPLGQQILELEIEARRSMMDEAVEDAAKAQAEDMMAEAAPRFDLLRAFTASNDLIEMNVMGAMNANLAFFQGMAEVGALSQDMTEGDMLADVWAQEPQIREETEAWIFPYLALAYGPLSDDEMTAYLAFSRSDAGQALNTALFGAFDAVFAAISRDLGRAAARQMMGQDI
jgi:hypothetical protein